MLYHVTEVLHCLSVVHLGLGAIGILIRNVNEGELVRNLTRETQYRGRRFANKGLSDL